MGLEYSYFEIVRSYIINKETIEQKPNGTIIKTGPNPYLSCIIISSLSLLMILYNDGGKGTLSKIFGHYCIDCHKKL